MIDPLLEESQGVTGDRQLRQFAWMWLVFFGALTWFKGIRLHHDTLAWTLGVLAVAVWLPGLLRPKSIRPLFSLLMALAQPIGWVVSNLILGILFYAIFTPLGLFFRLTGRDPLSLKRPPETQSLWEPMPAADDPRRYYHQYLSRDQSAAIENLMNEERKTAFEQAGARESSSLVGDLLRMARENKKYWLLPLILLVVGLGVLIILGGTGAAPFIYTLF